MPNGDEFNGDEFGELEDLRELLAERADDITDLVLIQMDDGEGFANVEVDGEWYGYDLADFDDELWEELFDYINDLDIDYVVYGEN